MKRVELRDVSVAGIGLLEVLRPFLNLSVFADLERGEALAGGGELRTELRVDREDFSGADQVREQVVDDLLCHRGRDVYVGGLAVWGLVAVLGRGGRAGAQVFGARVLYEKVEIKLGGLFHDGPGAVAQKLAIASKEVVLPVMLREPSTAPVPQAVLRVAGQRELSPGSRGVVDHE